MAEYKDREHYIPLRKSDLVDLLCRDLGANRAAAEDFRRLGEMISATFHYEYYKLLEELKDEYALCFCGRRCLRRTIRIHHRSGDPALTSVPVLEQPLFER